VRREINPTLNEVGKETMSMMGMMERDDYNLSMKHGLGADDARFKHGVTKEIRPLAKLPGDGCKPSSTKLFIHCCYLSKHEIIHLAYF